MAKSPLFSLILINIKKFFSQLIEKKSGQMAINVKILKIRPMDFSKCAIFTSFLSKNVRFLSLFRDFYRFLPFWSTLVVTIFFGHFWPFDHFFWPFDHFFYQRNTKSPKIFGHCPLFLAIFGHKIHRSQAREKKKRGCKICESPLPKSAYSSSFMTLASSSSAFS